MLLCQLGSKLSIDYIRAKKQNLGKCFPDYFYVTCIFPTSRFQSSPTVYEAEKKINTALQENEQVHIPYSIKFLCIYHTNKATPMEYANCIKSRAVIPPHHHKRGGHLHTKNQYLHYCFQRKYIYNFVFCKVDLRTFHLFQSELNLFLPFQFASKTCVYLLF